ncbi:MAG: hypothetical protein ACRD1K_06545 [Acidimicrobiales bacterium]
MDTTVADPRSMLKDAAFTAVGFAVIGLQRVQVQRREWERWVAQARHCRGSGAGSGAEAK